VWEGELTINPPTISQEKLLGLTVLSFPCSILISAAKRYSLSYQGAKRQNENKMSVDKNREAVFLADVGPDSILRDDRCVDFSSCIQAPQMIRQLMKLSLRSRVDFVHLHFCSDRQSLRGKLEEVRKPQRTLEILTDAPALSFQSKANICAVPVPIVKGIWRARSHTYCGSCMYMIRKPITRVHVTATKFCASTPRTNLNIVLCTYVLKNRNIHKSQNFSFDSMIGP